MIDDKDKLIEDSAEVETNEDITDTSIDNEDTDTEYRFLQDVAINENDEDTEEDSEEDSEEDIQDSQSEVVDLPKDKKVNSARPVKESYNRVMGTDTMTVIPKGLRFLVDGYMDYAKEVVVDRAIPDIDGMKPSQRRIMYIMRYVENVKDLRKCGDIAGSVMKIHPHGDASIYDTMVRMTHSSEYMNIPYIHGKGSFGKVFCRKGKAAAARYTECELSKITEELFQGMKGVEMLPSYNNSMLEPLLLPVSFPTILCNPSQGIAVGIASNIPAFNFNEVLKATIELIETDSISKPLAPDFTTGGCYINNPEELRSLMVTGNAKLKLRGKWHIEGKVIVITEIPYYTVVEDIMNKVKDLPGVNDVKDETDKNGLRLTIECANKKLVDSVLNEVLRVSPLQMTVSTNVVIIVDNKPRVLGIEEVLREWVKFRTDVLSEQIKAEKEELIIQIERYNILVDLMTTSKREPFLQTLLNEGRPAAKVLLGQYYPDANEEIFDWILEKSIGSLGGIGNKQISYLEELKVELGKKDGELLVVKERIVSELKTLDKKYTFQRLTEITDDDYNFDKKKTKKVVEPVPVAVVLSGKFIKKLKATPTNLALPDVIKCQSTDTISFIDNNGRLLRVMLDQIEFSSANDKGTYIPLYLGEQDDNFTFISYEIIEDKKVGYLYKDGYAAVINYNEWVDAKRKTKVTPIGLAPDYINLLLGSFDMSKGYIVMFTKKGKMGIVTNDFMEKTRRARTKLIHVGKGDEVVRVESLKASELTNCLVDQERFMGHFRVITKADGFNKELFESVCKKNK